MQSQEHDSFTVTTQADRRRFRIVLKKGQLPRLRVEKIKEHLVRASKIPLSEQVFQITSACSNEHAVIIR